MALLELRPIPRRMSDSTGKKLLWLSLFAFAMAQLEATVVVYLRALYYPDGFEFPLIIVRDRIAWIEIGREVATVLMLVGVAKLYSIGDAWRQYAAFLWAFGLWDIFYYVWLWIMLRWPDSLFDWDVLFLIPPIWVGPVLAPALIAAVMMLAGWLILRLRDDGKRVRVSRLEWIVTIGGALALIGLFVSDTRGIVAGDMPRPFNWLLYAAFLLPPIGAAGRAYRRSRWSG